MSLSRVTPILRRSIASRVRTISTTPIRRADPYPLPLSDLTLSTLADKTPKDRDDVPEEEWPMPKPLDRSHEDISALRSRLVYQTRKRGVLECDLLLSTFARDFLGEMDVEELRQFDKLLDEPDWDIFYWSVEKKEPPPKWKDTELLRKLIKHARNEGKVVRMMPELAQRLPEKS